MKIKDILEELIDKVPENQKLRYNCPSCFGENTLSISKIGSDVQWNCFRVSVGKCKLRGRKWRLASLDSLKSRLKGVFKPVETFSIPDYWIRGISSKKAFNIVLNTNSLVPYQKGYFNVAYDPRLNRLVYLVKLGSNIVGGVGRAMGKEKPKVYNYPNSADTPFTCGAGKYVVLVEDCASACAVSNHPKFSGLAMLGTSLKDEYIEYACKYDKIIVALDNDAKTVALKLKNTLTYYHKDVSIWFLNKDIKDMNNEELCDGLSLFI